MERLKNKVAIVTGAGGGIGRGIALMFAKEGAKVVVDDIDAKGGQETTDMIKKAGGDAAFIEADITKAADVQKMVKFTIEKFGKLTTLVNNAGFMGGDVYNNPITNLDEETWHEVIDVNLTSAFLTCKYAIPEMIKAGEGSIIDISSIAGTLIPIRAAYSAAKGGVNQMSKAIAAQFATKNIRSNVISVGAVETAALNAMMNRGDYGKIIDRNIPITGRLIAKMGKVDDVAYAAVYLASDESEYITASMLSVDGGSHGPRLEQYNK